MNKSARHRSLSRKLATSVCWVALLFAALSSLVMFVVEFDRASRKTTLMLDQLLDTVENTAAIAAYSGNRQIGEDVLHGLLRNDIIHQARLRNDRDLRLEQTRSPTAYLQDEVVRELRSPFGDGQIIGSLTVVPDARFSLMEARYSALFGTFNSFLLIGLTAGLVLALVRSYLSRPLMQVSEHLHAIKAGQQERLHALPKHGDDELGQLVEDINRLLDGLQERFEAERALRQEIESMERQLRGIFETTSAGIFLLDAEGRLLTANPTLARVLGVAETEMAAWNRRDFPGLAFAAPEAMRELMRLAEQRGRMVAVDLLLKAAEGSPARWVHCLLSKQYGVGNADCFEGVVYDITERRARESQVRREADHDPLTGLYRRQAVERRLRELMDMPSGHDDKPVVMLLDLDNFKTINDTHGHAAGDIVLMEVARRLLACVRSDDLVGRLGGDEFLIVLVNHLPLARIQAIAREIIGAVIQPIEISPVLAGRVGISIGIATHAQSRQSMQALFEAADQAMYEVKRQGKNGFGWIGDDGGVQVEIMDRLA